MASRLASLRRFSMEHLTQPESVLEHTGFVALVSLWLVTELNARGLDADVGTVLSRAVCHDLDELVTGDIPRPTKYSTPAAAALFDEIKRTAMDKVWQFAMPDFAFADAIRSCHDVAKEDYQGLIVAVADMLAVVYVVWREVILRGNLGLVRQALTVRHQLDKITERIRTETNLGPKDFLMSLVAEARQVAAAAAALDDPIHAAMLEEPT